MKFVLFLSMTLATTATWALPKAPFNAFEVQVPKLKSIDARNYDFEGIIKLSNCSGSLVQFNGQPDTAKGVIMTNGHCIEKPGGMLAHGEVWVNKPISRLMKIFDKNKKLTDLMTTKILYATMTNTDVAFYETALTYEEIFARTNVRPFELDTTHPVAGTPIDIISGYWNKGYSCNIDGFVYKIKEAGWTWNDSIRYTSTCDTIGGTSGSPIIARGERRVIGVNNTSNESGQQCTMNNPCEVNEAGQVVAAKGVRYGQQTFNVHTCLTMDFKFDLSIRGCELPR